MKRSKGLFKLIVLSFCLMGYATLVFAGDTGSGVDYAGLVSPDPEVRVNTARLLEHDAEIDIATSLPMLREAIKDSEPVVRKAALRAVWKGVFSSTESAEAVSKMLLPEMIELSDDVDPTVREESAKVLAIIGKSRSNIALPALIRLADDDVDAVRVAAISAIGSVGSQSRQATAILLSHMKTDRSSEARGSAAYALRHFALGEREINDVISATNDEDAFVRSQAVGTLGFLGSGALLALSSLEAKYNDPKVSRELREDIGFAIRSIRGAREQ